MVAKTVKLPNIRRMFIPDPGYMIGEFDLQQADAQVVAWEANDDELKAIFKNPDKDLHDENAITIFGDAKGSHRQDAKQGVHLTNYGGKEKTLARTLNITVAQAERFQRQWFQAHPGILEWHDRVENSLLTKRYIQNKFGNMRYYFSRLQDCFTEALAWIPQSTVALVINRGIVNLDKHLYPGKDKAKLNVELLMQVHDSCILQFRSEYFPDILPEIKKNLEILIPYDDPLTIPVDCSLSDISWGDVKKYNWDGTVKEKK